MATLTEAELKELVQYDAQTGRFMRAATRSGQAANIEGWSNNTSGYRGVHRLPTGKWRARGKFNGKHVHIGVFPTKELAFEAYSKIARAKFGDFFSQKAAVL